MPEISENEPIFAIDLLGQQLDYVGHPCPNCFRYRLIAYGSGKEICEKCNWCPQDNAYVDIDRLMKEKEDYYYAKEMDAVFQESALRKKEEEQTVLSYETVKKTIDLYMGGNRRIVQKCPDRWWRDDKAAKLNSQTIPGRHHSLRTLNIYENGEKRTKNGI